MNKYQEVQGDLIELAKQGKFDVIAHGCNCHCTMGAGIAPQMAKAFGCDEFSLERLTIEGFDGDEHYKINTNNRGNINKLGQIDFETVGIINGKVYSGWDSKSDVHKLIVVNAYTQYNYGKNHADGDKKPVDYDAIRLCMRKMNHIFKGKHIGLPKIGAGLAGGSWSIISKIIKSELADCDVTIVIYNK